ncbi:NUDIX hydrolase [Agrobacterium rosae]|uniref:NUDIX hydrolase n=1 Tax=Agrobacterium rosae TaxID=1972867 RepID=A0ABU4W8R4_9HYPH|nr:NUDIX hydrolase [Agrobacterium rosae]MDX8333047.1 NUDIX hydrolase [Agrobacterium rosae]
MLQQLAQNPDKLFNKPFARQCGAICFRYRPDHLDIEILLVTSRGSRRWIIPKGWPMKGKQPHQSAAIEALEEAGVRGKTRKTSVGSYVYLKDLANGDVRPCIVDVFQIEVIKVKCDFKERGQRICEWVSADEAARRVREIELKSMLINFNPRLRKVQCKGIQS